MKRLLALGLALTAAGCGGGSSSKSDDTSATTTTATGAAIASTLNMAYPGSLALSVFPTETASTTALADDEEAPESLKAKAEEAAEYLNGTAENCLPPVFLRPPQEVTETCYEFDQEMIVGRGPQSTYGTADGKSKITGSTEACLVSFARAQIKEIETLIDMGLGLQQGMICQAVKDEVDVAAADTEEGVDLKDSLDEAMDSSSDARKPTVTVSEATMSKEVDADGKDVFKVSIVISMKNDKGTFSQTYSLAHAPDSDDNSAYHGVMTLSRASATALQAGPGPGPSQSNKTHIISVTYSKTADAGANVINAELRSARFAKDLLSLATVDGVVDFNASADFTVASTNTNYGKYKNPTSGSYYTQPNDAVEGMLFVGYNLNIDDNTGNFEYWQNPGGNYSESARGMIFEIEKDDAGLHGCGMSGAVLGATNPFADSVSIRRSIKEGTELVPNGFFHPFFTNGKDAGGTPKVYYKDDNNNNVKDSTESYWTVPSLTDATKASTWANSQTGNLVSRQCVRQDATSGEYRIDTTKITEAAGFDLFNPTSSPDFVIARPERPPLPPAPAAAR